MHICILFIRAALISFLMVVVPVSYAGEDIVKTGMPSAGLHPVLDQFVSGTLSEDAFWQKLAEVGTPLVTTGATDAGGKKTVQMTFLWQGAAGTTSVELLGSKRTADRRDNLMANIEGTHVWFKTLEVPSDSAMSYNFALNLAHLMGTEEYRDQVFKTLKHDPFNKNIWHMKESRFATVSIAKGPDAKDPYWSLTKEGVPEGRVESHVFHSNSMAVDRGISLYFPPGQPAAAGLPIVFIFDGEKYLHDANTDSSLDNLIHEQKIPPVLAVFVDNTKPTQRGEELPCNPMFINFLADELLPWVKAQAPAAVSSTDIVVAGSSYGGLASACANLFRPEVFNHVLSQSGSYWWSPTDEASALADGQKAGWVSRRFADKACGDAKYYFDAGAFEWGDSEDSIGNSTDTLYKLMKAKGCTTVSRSFPGGHDLLFWRETLPEGLIWLLGDAAK